MPHSDRTVLISALHSAMGPEPINGDPQRALAFYRSALELSWIQMSMVVGTMGARTITDHGARVASRKFPNLSVVRVTDEGLDFAPFLSSASKVDPASHVASMEEFCLSVFEVLRELTGDVIVAPMLEKLKVSAREGEAPAEPPVS